VAASPPLPAATAEAPSPEAVSAFAENEHLQALLSDIDRKADPCDSFYDYACGGWFASTERPADQPRYSRSFSQLSDRNQDVLKKILEDSARKSAEGDRLGAYYVSCMDEDGIEVRGSTPLDELTAKIDGANSRAELWSVVGELHASVWGRMGWFDEGSPFFKIDVDADYKDDPKTNIAHVTQSGLGLPSRDMYLALGESARATLEAYRLHVERMLVLSGFSARKAPKEAAAIINLESKMAQAMLSPIEMRDDEKNYHKEGTSGLRKRARSVDWDAYFRGSGWPQSDLYNLRTPDYLSEMAKLVKETPLSTLKAYLRWQVTHAMAAKLPKTFVDEAFELEKLTAGAEALEPRWKRCSQDAMFALPDLLGPKFVEQRFAGESKTIAMDMIDRINGAMESSFPSLRWMDDATREVAVKKIKAMGRKIGYPDLWREYPALEISARDYFANSLAEKTADHRRTAEKIGKTVDINEWGMPTPIVNAYFNPTNNEIAFPAGIMQPPFFDKDMPQAMNYGGLGAVMGHELTHGFDDQGRKYDASGRLKQWWSPEVSAAFEERVACVQDQYDAYEVLPGVSVQGKLTSGENIADIGGVKEAFVAYKAWESENAASAPVAAGFTNEQVFFVAWAQNWCTLATDEFYKRQVESDPHSPGRFRAEGPLADFPAFAEAFSCAAGSAMAPKNACEVW
jgi:predicted metalloendopeptidase